MRKLLTRFALLLVAIASPLLVVDATACTCGPPSSPYREYQDSKIVFVGKVLSSKDHSVTEKILDKTITLDERVFEFSVSETLKGPKRSKIEINMGAIKSSCYHGFAIGEEYLVYAFGDSDITLSSGACSRTNNLAYATDDLYYIRELLKGVPEPRVYGSVMRIDSDLGASKSKSRVTPLAGIKVLIEGKSNKFEAVTNQQGLYSLSKIPDGKYKAYAVLPEKYNSFPSYVEFFLGSPQEFANERTQHGSSAYAAFHIGWNNYLKGRIVDSEGNPIFRAKVSVLLARSSASLVIKRDQNDYHPEGNFQFYGINPGQYLLSADIRAPFTDNKKTTTFYYSSANSLDQAREISIGDNEMLEDREIRLPPGYVVRTIEGVLVWPNGVPVSGGSVFLADSKVSANDDKKFDWATTDVMGRFSLQAFVGAEYWVHGIGNSSGQGEPVKINVQMVNEPLKIVVPFPKRIDQ